MYHARILVADDSRTVRTCVRRTLVSAGFEVILASDGKEALQCARRDRPDLVILDIQMPEMDGYAACEGILELENRRSTVPIVFLTRESAQHLDALGNQMGAYLQKPVTEERLLSTIRALLDRSAVVPRDCQGIIV